MTLAQLQQAGRAPALPIELQLPDGQSLQLQQWLRVLPGQRYVARAQWQGRSVLAKLLVGRRALRHFQREQRGARLLADQGLTTPALLAAGSVAGQGGWLLFEYLDGAVSLWQRWQALAGRDPLDAGHRALLGEALTAIAGMHRQGLWQADLHLDNLLHAHGRLWLVDGGAVQAEQPGQPLPAARVLDNLGVFLAQLPVALDARLPELLALYPQSGPPLDVAALRERIARVRRWRLRDYLKKTGRDCSLFSARSGPFGLRVVRRGEQAALAGLLDDPDALLPGAQLYKTGGAATVARIDWQGRALVLKRYNIKHLWHALKRCWRPSRAWHSWREGHRLELLGIATPRPLAVLERRWLWLRGPAWLVSEHCAGDDLIARFSGCLEQPPAEPELQALEQLLGALIRERISHGDLKGHNLFWDDAQQCWSLIDLDAMRQHRCPRRFARAFARDRARLLRNWPQDSALYRLLDARLPRL